LLEMACAASDATTVSLCRCWRLHRWDGSGWAKGVCRLHRRLPGAALPGVPAARALALAQIGFVGTDRV